MEADEVEALTGAVERVRQLEAWTNLHELTAAVVEALWAILSRLEAGMPMIQVDQLKKPVERGTYPRPDWVGEPESDTIVVKHVADAFRILKAAKGGGADAN